MRTTKKNTAATIETVAPMIAAAVILEQQAKEMLAKAKAHRAAIKESLQAAGLQRFATPAGHEALLIERITLSWNVAKIEALKLDDEEFDALCPRRPNSEQLRAWLEGAAGTASESKIRACARGSKRVDLELRPPAVKPNEVAVEAAKKATA